MVGLGVLAVAVEPVVYLLIHWLQQGIVWIIQQFIRLATTIQKSVHKLIQLIRHFIHTLKNKKQSKQSKKI